MTETPPHLAKLFSLAEARRKKQEKREANRGADDSWYDTIMLWIELIPVKYRDHCIREMCRTLYAKMPDADSLLCQILMLADPSFLIVLTTFLAESRQFEKPPEERRVLLKALRATAKRLGRVADGEDALERRPSRKSQAEITHLIAEIAELLKQELPLTELNELIAAPHDWMTPEKQYRLLYILRSRANLFHELADILDPWNELGIPRDAV